MTMLWYGLDGQPITMLQAGELLADGEARRVRRTDISEGVYVSTVFLVLDHGYVREGAPVLWETMIFGGDQDGYQDRYTSREAAEIGHLAAVNLALGIAGAVE